MKPARILPTILAGLALTLAGCAGDPQAPRPSDTSVTSAASGVAAGEIAEAHGLSGMDARAIIERLEATAVAERPSDLRASVRPEALVLSDTAGRETSLSMPADAYYLSVAPYRQQTHDCYFHSLTTCRGELRGEDVTVRIVDATGAVLIDQDIRTNDNGFLGLWLPRDLEATMTIEDDGLSATAPIATGSGDATCLTTLRLT